MIKLDRNELKNCAFNIKGKTVYYFDENGIVRTFPYDEAKEHVEIKGLLGGLDGHIYIDFWKVHFNIFERVKFNVLKMVLEKIKEGDTIDDMEHYINTLYPKPPGERKQDELDRFICRFYKPEFLRLPENTKKNTFDFIVVEVSVLSQEALPDRDDFLKQNIKEILTRLVEKIENSATFKKYGIPSKCLKATEVTLHKKISILKVVFELKQIS
ncbi:MAG: hypothetical protein IKR04_02520 [Clostridia bacterium]|nr:hypothetical protein [Clostridia bacterium]